MYINVQKLFVVVHVDGYKDLSKSGSTQQVDSMIHESRRYSLALQICEPAAPGVTYPQSLRHERLRGFFAL